MGRKLPPEQLKLYKRCDEVLQYIWDPIGVAGCPGARDEYETYLPMVFKLLIAGETEEKITDYLVSIETESMGMESKRDLASHAATALVAWREWINDEAL
jgi:hypothetical protein